MPYPQGPYAVDPTDYQFDANGSRWCLSIEYEDADGGYSPVLWILQNGNWTAPYGGLAQFHVRNAADIIAKWGSPAGYLRAILAKATQMMMDATNVPLPDPIDALSRSLYHAKKSIRWDGAKLDIINPDKQLDP